MYGFNRAVLYWKREMTEAHSGTNSWRFLIEKMEDATQNKNLEEVGGGESSKKIWVKSYSFETKLFFVIIKNNPKSVKVHGQKSFQRNKK